MKDIVLQIMQERLEYHIRTAPKTKKVKKYVSLFSEDVKPNELLKFMKENNIPEDADFDGETNSYDGYEDFGLSWCVEEPTTEKEKQDNYIKRFNVNVFSYVAKAYYANGYIRPGFWSGELDRFKDTTLYHMFVNKEYDRLMDYFGLYFKKKN